MATSTSATPTAPSKPMINNSAVKGFQSRSRPTPLLSFSEKMHHSPGRKAHPPPPLSLHSRPPPLKNHPLSSSSLASASHQSWEVAMVPLRNKSSMRVTYSTKGPVPKLKSSESAIKIYYEYDNDYLEDEKIRDEPDGVRNGDVESDKETASIYCCCSSSRQTIPKTDQRDNQNNRQRRMNHMFRKSEHFCKVCLTVSYFLLGLMIGLLLILAIAYFTITKQQ